MNTSLLLIAGLGLIPDASVSLPPFTLGLLPALAVVVLLAGTIGDGQKKTLRVGKLCDPDGKARVFTLTLMGETASLNPGMPWIKLDTHKWVTRGLMEAPPSFRVLANGAVEINGEKIALDDPEGIGKLEEVMNKRHEIVLPPKPEPVAHGGHPDSGSAARPGTSKVRFKVVLDGVGHLLIECYRGAERIETGLRGLPILVQNGLMLKPQTIHVDPLMRAVEIDETRFECCEAGARLLQEVLNSRYAPDLKSDEGIAIEIKDNPASATGFDIRFFTVHSGLRIETKGHLSQDKLDILQDSARSGLLHPGIVLRLTPPNLAFRRRRSDGSEERLPDFPDVPYRRTTSLQLQQLFNHPAICRAAAKSAAAPPTAPKETPPEIIELRLSRNPQSAQSLWLEMVAATGDPLEGRAFTHHNVAELQHHQVFQPILNVSLSLDNRTLTIHNQETKQAETITFDDLGGDANLTKASRLLTSALRPVPVRSRPPPVRDNVPVAAAPILAPTAPPIPAPVADEVVKPEPPVAPIPIPAVVAGPVVAEPPMAGPLPDQGILDLFRETDPLRINTEVFRSLGLRLGLPVQDVRLSLPRVFENRRFEVISPSHSDVTDVLELRSDQFVGFYLAHINDRGTLLVYGCRGKHIEWGPQRCLLELAIAAEPNEVRQKGLVGMAQDEEARFVFVVEPAFKEWVRPYEKSCQEAFARFATIHELAVAPERFSLIWPNHGGAQTLVVPTPIRPPW